MCEHRSDLILCHPSGVLHFHFIEFQGLPPLAIDDHPSGVKNIAFP